MFDLEKFKKGGYFVHLPTQEIYDEAMKFLEENGMSWHQHKATDKQIWERYREETGINFEGHILYADKPYYEEEGFKEILLNQKEVVKQKINLEGNNDLLADNASHYTKLMLENKSIYLDKNEKYGDAFAETIKKYGYISALTRMNDKFNRIEEFTLKGFQDEEESLRDSLMDLANYCYMYVMELDKEKEDSFE